MTTGTANRIDGFDGRIVAAETFDGAGAMLQVALPAASEKDMTLSAYARAWLAGMEGSGSAGLNAPLRPYQQSLWVYRCVSEIFKACAGIPLRLSRESAGLKYSSKGFRAEIRRTKVRTLRPAKGRQAVCLGRAAEGELIEAGPANELLSHPNDYQDWPAFFQSLIGYLLLRGKVAIVMTDFVGRRPGQLHVIDGKYIKPKWAKGESGMPVLLGYVYRAPKSGQDVALAIDEVKYFSLWDDTDEPLGGMSPCTPGKLAIATEHNASLYNASALVNSCEPGITITFPQNLTPEQREEFRAALRHRHRGPTKPKRELILEGGAKAEAFATTLRDLQFDAGKKTTRLEICCLWGVPPVVAGWVEAAGDSSAYTSNALRQFYQQTIFPLLDGFAPAIQEIVSRLDPAAVVWFDVEDQPVVEEMRLSRLESADRLFRMGYPTNAINDVLDLGMPELPWGDVGFLPTNLLPASDVAAGNTFPSYPEGTSTEGADELDQAAAPPAAGKRPPAPQADAAFDKAAADRIWADWAASWNPLARAIGNALRQRYLAQQRKLIKLITDAGAAAGEGRAAAQTKLDDSVIGRVLLEVFGDGDDRRRFRSRMAAFTTDANELGIRQALVEAGFEGDKLDEATRRLLSSPRIATAIRADAVRVSTLIDDFTRKVLRNSLADGLAAGEDARHLADRVQAVMGNRRKAALTVARNSVGQALSSSRHAGHVAGGMTHKGWMHSRGPGERREAHVAGERRYMAEPIPLGQPFIINGVALMYPRDFSSGHAEETANCQCLQIAKRLPRGAAAPTAEELCRPYLIGGFLGYAAMLAARQSQKGDKGDE